MKLEDLDTPAAVIDLDRVERNLRRTAAYCSAHGLGWRPHVKTHKTRELAEAQIRAGALGLAVATLDEAEAVAGAGGSLLLAYPPVGAAKLARLMALPAGLDLLVSLDSEHVLRDLARAAHEAGREIGVLVEIDGGMGRVGVQTPEEAVALARAAAQRRGVAYRGVVFYPGHIRAAGTEQDMAIAALSSRLDAFLAALTMAGLAPRIVSGGSTPTRDQSHRVAGVTEIRPGTDVFNDRITWGMGACGWEDLAYTVLATVVSTAVSGQAVVDAGAKALAREDPGPGLRGFGALLDHPEVVVHAVSEEHGRLDLAGSNLGFRVGDRVRIVPNHVCVSTNLHSYLHPVRNGDVLGRWKVARR